MPSTKLKTTQKLSWKFDAIGTKWEVLTHREVNNSLKLYIQQTIEAFDQTYSRFRADSLVSKMSKLAGEYEFPESSKSIFDFYDELWEVTDYKVTPMVGDTLASAGYDPEYSLKPNELIKPILNYKKVLKREGVKLSLAEKAQLDIGAVGKGYLIDVITQILIDNGHDSFVVDGSGDLRVVGDQQETVGFENPLDATQVIGTVDISNRALCASATNRRAWGDWHHVIDPVSGKPTEEIIATWVIADTAMIADGLATALFFTAPQKLAKRYTYEYMRMHADGSVDYSNYFAKGVF